ncbi:Na+/H+ antiporter subunit E [Blastococcus sp. CCUG 61487]|uniref:Na+/H+ antiporter subunit E n=1 Tax=Blastococcus sp. CCUG 61487 TaxID=1840703 RepID=UPI0010C0EED3|nr:Na+/H+ antiporter subunit E [Blastococcus sp. CCUG 61487]TKJ18122.1 hypothetical protein A6V29_12345 [Blastococcus sp. CCUG 61487]
MSRRWGPARVRTIAGFLGWYLLTFLRANYRVAKEIVMPSDGLAPTFAEVPLRTRTRAETASYISLVTLSPGTLVIAVRTDPSRLLAHGMHARDPDSFRTELLELQDRLLAAWRPVDQQQAAPAAPTSEGEPT